MPATVNHVLTATTPDDPLYEIRPSHWNSAHALTFNAVGSEISGAFDNAGGVTFGLETNGFITAAAPAGGGGLTNINVSAGTTSNNLSALTFNNSNGVSFGLNGSVITATVATNYQSQGAYLTTARASNDAIGLNTALTANGVSVTANSSGLSLNFPAFLTTAQPVGAYLTTARASNDAVGLNTALTAGPLAWTVNSSGISLNAASAAGTTSGFSGNLISGSMTHNTAGLALSLTHPAWLTTAALSNHSHGASANNGSFAFQTLSFSNANGVSFGTSAGSAITASHNGLTTARASNDAVGLNTAQTNVTWTVNSSGISLNAAGYAGTGTSATNASITLNSNGLAISVAAPGGGGGTTNQTGPNIGVSNIGNTLGTTGTVSIGNYVLAGIGAVTLSQSSSASNGTLSISVAPQVTESLYSPPWINSGMATNSSLGQSSLYFMPFDLPFHVYASRVQFFVSLSGAISAGNSTGTCSNRLGYAIYSLGTGTNSDRLTQITSYSAILVTHSVSSNTQYAATHYIGLSDITSHSTSQVGISNANASTYLASSINGLRAVNFPVNSTMEPGRYWMGVSVQTTAGNAMTNGVSVLHTAANLHPAIVAWGVNSVATNNSVFRPMQGFGTYSAQSAAWPNSIAFTTDNIRHGVSQTMVHFNLLGYATSTNLM